MPTRRTAGCARTRKRSRRSTRTKLTDLQERVWAEGKHSVLIVLQGIDAAGKDGTIRHVMDAFNPQGAAWSASRRPRRGAAPRLPVAHPSRTPRPRATSPSSTAATTRTCSSSGSMASSREDLAGPLPVDQRFRADADRGRHDHPQVLPVHRPRRAARAAPGAPRRSRQALEVLVSGPPGARALGRLHRGVPGRADADVDQVGAVVPHPRQPQVVPQPRGGARAGRDARGTSTRSTRPPRPAWRASSSRSSLRRSKAISGSRRPFTTSDSTSPMRRAPMRS